MKKSNFIPVILFFIVLISCQNNAVQDELVVIAGTGNAGFKDGVNPELFKPIRLSTYKDNSVLFADAGNQKLYRVKPGISAESIPLADTLNTPHGITVDDESNMYIADMGTNRILKIDNAGNFSTLVDATLDSTKVSSLKKPAAVLYDQGYLWIADLNNHQLKRLKIK